MSYLLIALFAATALGLAAWYFKWELVDDWRLWWRKWSTLFSGLNAAAWTYVTAHTGLLLGFIPFLPGDWRGFGAGMVFAIAFPIPILVAHVRQRKLREKLHG